MNHISIIYGYTINTIFFKLIFFIINYVKIEYYL